MGALADALMDLWLRLLDVCAEDLLTQPPRPTCDARAAAPSVPHDVKGESVYAFVTLMDGVPSDDAMKKALSAAVRSQIGSFAVPDTIHW
jgi:acyl-CoA synthetase (AMP-forming)/AMP-acid ligase II